MPIDAETLKSERDQLRLHLRELETELRKTEAKLKNQRQQELKTKREIEALSTLIELQETRSEEPDENEASSE